MLLVVIDAFEASSQNATAEDQMQRAIVWTDLLIDLVPENRLQDAFKRAFQDHNSPFPVNAYELKNAWEQIDHTEKVLRRIELENDQRENPVKYCESKWNHINEEGDIEIYLGVPPNGKEVIVPCQDCRKGGFFHRYNEERAKFITEQPEMESLMQQSTVDVILKMLADARKVPRERRQAKSAVGILIQAKLDGGDKEILSNAILYVRKANASQAT